MTQDTRKSFGAIITGVFNDRVTLRIENGQLPKGLEFEASRSRDFAKDMLSQGCGKGQYVEGVAEGEGKNRRYRHLTFIV